MLLSVGGALLSANRPEGVSQCRTLFAPEDSGGSRKAREAAARFDARLAQGGCAALNIRPNSDGSVTLDAVTRCGSGFCARADAQSASASEVRFVESLSPVFGPSATTVCITERWVVTTSSCRLSCAPRASVTKDREPKGGRSCTLPEGKCVQLCADVQRACALVYPTRCCVVALPDLSDSSCPFLVATVDMGTVGVAQMLTGSWPQGKDARAAILAVARCGGHVDPATVSRAPVVVVTLDASRAVHGKTGGVEMEGRHTVSEGEAPVCCAAASACGRLWAVGCTDGALLCHNCEGRQSARSPAPEPGVRALGLCFSDVFIVASMSSACINVYDWGCTPIRVVFQGAGPASFSLRLQDFFGGFATAHVLAGDSSGAVAVAGETGPMGLLWLGGGGGAMGVARRRGGSGIVSFLRMVGKGERLALIAAAAARAYADQDGALLEEMAIAFAPSYRDGGDRQVFAGIFRRHFDGALQQGQFRTAFRVADALNLPSMFDELHAYAKNTGAPDSLCAVVLDRATPAVRDDESQHRTLQAWTQAIGAHAGYTAADLDNLHKWEEEGGPVPLSAAPRLVRMEGLYQGVTQARACAERYAARARADGDTETEQAVLAEVPADLIGAQQD
eukprot:Hpha_TRINITY_DN19609_c0_g1::TRINITY_DN19609_c0_g1_i1::g.186232::m.186232